MARWQRIYLAACAGVIAYALAYVGVDYAKVARPWYFPHERDYELRAGVPDPVAMGYVGLWLWALIAGVVVAAVTWLGTRRRRRDASSRTLGLMRAWALTAVALAAAYHTWHNWP